MSALCYRQQLYGRIGTSLDPERMPTASARLALRAAKAIFTEIGNGPPNFGVVLQRLRRWQSDGKIKASDISAVDELFDMGSDFGPSDDEALVNEVLPILRKSIHRNAIDTATREYANPQGDPGAALRVLDQIHRLGTQDKSLGITVGNAVAERLVKFANIHRLPTCIPELDDILRGGVARGTETIFLGETGAGKSMALIQMTTSAASQMQSVCYASLELEEEWIEARILSNITGIPSEDMMRKGADPGIYAECEEMMGKLGAAEFGRITVRTFPAGTTSPKDIFEWVSDVEEATGVPVSVLVVDYADKCASSQKKTGKWEESAYIRNGLVYEEFRVWASKNKKWLFTASQTKRGQNAKRSKVGAVIDTDDAADSLDKMRVGDLIISINLSEDRQTAVLFIAKNRHGDGGGRLPALPTDFACSRIVPTVHLGPTASVLSGRRR